MSKPYKRVLYNTALLTIIRIIGDFSGLILYIFLSRNFGPDGIGLYAFGLSIGLIAYYLINFGFDDYGIREYSFVPHNQKNIFIGKIAGVQILLLIISLLLFIPFILLAKLTFEAVIVNFSVLMNMISLVFSKTFFIPFNSQEKMIFPALTELFMKIFYVAAAGAAIALFDAPLYAALLPLSLSGILMLTAAVISFKKIGGKINLRINWNDSVSLIKTVWPFSASLMIYSVYNRIGVIIITFFIGSAAAGIFAPAQKFLEVGLMPVILFSFSIYPVLSKYYKNDTRKFEDSAEKLFRAVFVIAWVLLWGLFFVVPLFVVPLLGERFAPSVSLIRYFSILIFLNSLTIVFHKLLLSAGMQVLRTKAHFTALIINAAGNFLLIPRFGPAGAVFALIISESILNILFLNILRKKIKPFFSKLIRAFAHFLISFGFSSAGAAVSIYFTGSRWYAMTAAFVIFVLGLIFTGYLRKFDVSIFKPAAS